MSAKIHFSISFTFDALLERQKKIPLELFYTRALEHNDTLTSSVWLCSKENSISEGMTIKWDLQL